MFVFVSDRFFFSCTFTMSLAGVIQGLDDNGDPKQGVVMLGRAEAAAVERLLPLLGQCPYLLQTGLALLNKYNQFPCPFPVTEDYSFRGDDRVHIRLPRP